LIIVDFETTNVLIDDTFIKNWDENLKESLDLKNSVKTKKSGLVKKNQNVFPDEIFDSFEPEV